MAKLKFIDKREETVPTFSDLNIGDLFTSVGEEFPFIKIAVMYNEHKDSYNTVSIDGEFYWSDGDEEVRPIQELEVTIKK